MTDPATVPIDWIRATMWGAALGGAFWAVAMRFIVAESSPSLSIVLCVIAFVSSAAIGIGGLMMYGLGGRRTAGAAIALAPLTGWVAILIYIAV